MSTQVEPGADLNRTISLLDAVIESTTDGILVVERNGKIAHFNRKFAKIWNIPDSVLADRDDNRALASVLDQLKEPEHFLAKVRLLYGQPEASSFDVLEFKDGRIFERYSQPQKLGAEIVGRVWSFRDVTKRVRAEAALKLLGETNELLETALHYQATLEKTAELAARHFGGCCVIHTPDENGLLRASVLRQAEGPLVPDSAAEAAPARVFASREAELDARMDEDGENKGNRPGARSFICVPIGDRRTTRGTLLLTSNNRLYDRQDLALARELAHRAAVAIENAELYDRAQKAIQLREDFMSIAAHELRTPLTPLKLQLDLLSVLLRSLAPGATLDREKILPLIGSSDRQIMKLARLIDELLDGSRLSMGRLTLSRETLDLSELVREALERFEPELAKAGCTVQAQLAQGLVGRLDRLRVEQVVLNLLSNAMKYGAGKPVRIETRREGPQLYFSVQDLGIGIASEDHERIFDRFERAAPAQHFGGLGLGLFISRQIVQAHGGAITVQSHPGQGSTFSVALPAA
jgi:PAS domain S-box-containing protein